MRVEEFLCGVCPYAICWYAVHHVLDLAEMNSPANGICIMTTH